MFSEKAKNIDKIFTVNNYVVIVKSTVKISSIFVAFLENMNFIPETPQPILPYRA